MRPRLRDIAEETGVSLATVSRVINGRPGVADPTRRTVLDALARHGFVDVPVRARTNVVGIITPELENPIFPLLAQTIESRLARHGLLGMLCPSTPETAAEQDYLEYFAGIGAAGVVVIAGRYAGLGVGYGPYEALEKRGLPVVLVNGVSEAAPVPAIGTDLSSAAEQGVEHLVALGHERIACLVGPLRFQTSEDLISGFRRGLAGAGRDVDEDMIVETAFTIEGGSSGGAQLIERGATGIVASSDLMALGVIDAARASGLEVPDDLSVIGFDGTPLVQMTDPPLTSARQPIERMASAVAAMIVSGSDATPRFQLFRPDLVVGRSTGPVPARV